jgi:hypothetical protein
MQKFESQFFFKLANKIHSIFESLLILLSGTKGEILGIDFTS